MSARSGRPRTRSPRTASLRSGGSRSRQLTLSGVVAAVLVAVLVALADQLAGPATGTAPTGLPDAAEVQREIDGAAPGSALAAAGELAVKGRAPRTGYDRERFGEAWADVDRNGCDTRNDVLARDLDDEELRAGSDCVVLSGVLHDPYGPSTIDFRRGADTSSEVQIDHVVALSDAWQKGAQSWSAGVREAFANDPLNLLAVDGPLNQAKSDSDAATWLPPNRDYRCTYVARQVAVKLDYGLWVTAAELAAVVGVLDDCPDQRLPG